MSIKFKDWVMEQQENIQENIVDLTYVADRLTRITDASDKDLRKEIEEFREECLRNIGVNVVNGYNE